jgi:hypothetical protein
MMKHTLAKYLMCSAAASAFALVPFSAQAQEVTSTTTTSVTTTTAEPTLVSGTVVRYYVDPTGYVTAADIQTAEGVRMVHFPANRASYIYTNAPVGGTVNLWVAPSANDATYYSVVGWGQDRPGYWWGTVQTTALDWLKAEPYINAGAQQVEVDGTLKGAVTDDNGEILALVIDTGTSMNLVRVPPEMRQIAPDHTGDERVTPLFRNAAVEVVGVPEAPRVGGLVGYSQTIAANSIRINGDTVGAIGLPARKVGNAGSLFDWNFGGVDEMSADEVRAYNMGYRTYVPITTTISSAPMGSMTTTTTTTTTSSATGQVKIVAADGTQYPVVQRDGNLWAQAADGTLTRIQKRNGKYVVPASMTGARMVMVMADGSQLNMDTVNGQLMVVMADGSMAPVTLHTP